MPELFLRPSQISANGSTSGQVLTSNGTAVYWATGTGGGGGGASITISDNPPGSPTAGSLWWNSNTGYMFVYYNDGDSSQWVETSPRTTGTANNVEDSIILNLTLGLL